MLIAGVETTHLSYIDYDKDEICVGPKNLDVPLYYIEPDFLPCDIVMEYYEKFCENNNTVFPEVPVAVPGVPTNKIYKCDEEYRLERVFMNRDCYIADPRPGQFDALGGSGMFATAHEAEGTVRFKDLRKGSKVFMSYSDKVLDYAKLFPDIVFIGMQFNPFHPMSKEKIDTIEWYDENKCRGRYKYRGTTVLFDFDLDSTRYRMHSDQWIPNMCLPSGYYEVYDLVSCSDFATILDFTLVRNDIEPFVVEPIVRKGDGLFCSPCIRNPIYSIIGPWQGEVHRGMGSFFYSPGLTSVQREPVDSDWYEEITEYCDIDVMKDVMKIERDGRIENVLMKVETRKKKARYNIKYEALATYAKPYILQSEDIFLKLGRYSFNKFQWRVFRRLPLTDQKKDWVCHPYYRFVYARGCQFRSFPCNKTGSIIYGLSAMSLLDVMCVKKNKCRYLPLSVPVPLYNGMKIEKMDLNQLFGHRGNDPDYDINVDIFMEYDKEVAFDDKDQGVYDFNM